MSEEKHRSDYGVKKNDKNDDINGIIQKFKSGKNVLTYDEYKKLTEFMHKPGSKINEELKKNKEKYRHLDTLAVSLAQKVKSKMNKGEPYSAVDNLILNVANKNNLDDHETEMLRAKIRDLIYSGEQMVYKNKVNDHYFTSSINRVIGGPLTLDVPFSISDEDKPAASEITKKFVENETLAQAMFAITKLYEDCGPMALATRQNSQFTSPINANNAINPVFFILYVPKYEVFENLTLLSSYGRIVARRAAGKAIDNEDDLMLLNNIRGDPNDFAYSTSKSALDDIKQRYNAQLAVQGVVYCIRNGLYNNCDDHAKLIKALASGQKRDYFDANYKDALGSEIYLSQNYDPSINIIRMLFANFSYRPVFVSTQEDPQMNPFLNFSMIGTSHPLGNTIKNTLETIPYLTYYVQNPTETYQLQSALEGYSWFTKQDRLVIKKQITLHAVGLLVIHVIRRRMTYTNSSNNKSYSFFSAPWIQTKAESNVDVALEVNDSIKTEVGDSLYYLRGVLGKKVFEVDKVKYPGNDFGMVRRLRNAQHGVLENGYYLYDPLAPMVPIKQTRTGSNIEEFVQNNAISAIDEQGSDDFLSTDAIGFFPLARKYGTVFIYAKQPNEYTKTSGISFIL